MREIFYNESYNFYISIFGLCLAIFDFTGLNSLINRHFEILIHNLKYFIFTDRTGVIQWMEGVSDIILNCCQSIYQFILQFVMLVCGLISVLIVLILFLGIITILTAGLTFPLILLAVAAWEALVILMVYMAMNVSIVQYAFIVVLTCVLFGISIIVLFYILYGLMKISQPIVLSFPWTILLPFYVFFKLLNSFPGKTLGTVGLIIATISTIFSGYPFLIHR